jgi:hypothetical protein
MLATTSRFLHYTLAEWRPISSVVRRTPLGLWLGTLAVGAVWIAGRPGGIALSTLALVVALTAAVAAAATLADRDAAHAAALTLRHPASATALAAGRWLGVVTLAGAITVLATMGAAWRVGAGWREGMDAVLGAACALTPVAACALAAARLGGGVLEWLFLAHLLLLSPLAPDAMSLLLPDGFLHHAALVMVVALPAVWRYRLLGAGNVAAWTHAAAWTVIGVLTVSISLRRRMP